MTPGKTFAEHKRFFMEVMFYDAPMATFLTTLMRIANQAHPKRPMDVANVEAVKPDWRMQMPMQHISSPDNPAMRPGYEWCYPF